MNTLLTIFFAVAALQFGSARVVITGEGPSADELPVPPAIVEPPLEVPQEKTEGPVIAHAVEHTEEQNDRPDKVDGYDPNDGVLQPYEVTPEQEFDAEVAGGPKPPPVVPSAADDFSTDNVVDIPVE